MPNMHYCRFQNTLADLRECIGSINEDEPLGLEEHDARRKPITEMADFIFGNFIDDEDEAREFADGLPKLSD